ncbi:MAG: hypothetical protein WA771_06870 [Chthoniobacterales bacterium]
MPPEPKRRTARLPPKKKAPARRKAAAPKDEDSMSAEHRRLLDAQEELKRKQEKLQRLIQQAPARKAAQKKKQREPIRLDVASAGTMSRPGLRSKYADNREVPLRRRARRSERNLARVQFLVLCLILLSIVFAIWRVIP